LIAGAVRLPAGRLGLAGCPGTATIRNYGTGIRPPPFYVDHLANVLREGGVDIAKNPIVQLKYLKKLSLLSKGKIKMCLINCTKHSWQGVVLVTPAIQISIDSGTKLPASTKLVTIISDIC
jgi:hypothetical protein